MNLNRPPCWPEGQPCPNQCASSHYERTVYNRHHLPEPWHGWRFAGRDLISPDGDRLTPERLRGIVWAETNRLRIAKQREKRVSRMTVTVIKVANDDWHRDRFGCIAG